MILEPKSFSHSKQEKPDSSDVKEHFTARAEKYDRSSRWCTDEDMMRYVIEAAAPSSRHRMLDVACGTGLITRAFRKHVASIVGLDLTPAMAAMAEPYLDSLVLGSAERMPFADREFDIVVCRQGIQFMNAAKAVKEMVRVVRPGGRIVLVNLCAYGEGDQKEYFRILHLRNPARKNFFVPSDITDLLRNAGCSQWHLYPYVIEEDVDVWSDNGAISDLNREEIRNIYRNASPEFQRHHGVKIAGNRIIDRMLFSITAGVGL
jgi:SAM-dependent methyltransferase